MNKKEKIYLVFSFFSLFIFILSTILPLQVSAQAHAKHSSYSSEGESPFGNDSGQISQWRNRSNATGNAINNLDNDKVIDLPLPILFGLTPDNLTRNFGDPRSGGRTHEGLDILAPRRALVVSPTDAVVIRVGVGDSSGNYVYTANPGDETFAYMHLDEPSTLSEGDILKKGDFIGYVGNTGNAAGGPTHLHFEVRDDNVATDPFPRLTRIFPLADKIDYLKKILSDAKDEKALAESVVGLYRKDLLLAQSLNIALPNSIIAALTNKVTETATISRTLKLGSKGDDVKLLQENLGISADGSFGPKTKAAVIAFQQSKGLTADGVFGAKSRLALASSAGILKAGCTAATAFSATTGVKCQ